MRYRDDPQLPQESGARTPIEAAIQYEIAMGGRLASQTASQAVVIHGKPVNHILHLLLSVFTAGIWLIIWIIMAASGGERRAILEVRSDGTVMMDGRTHPAAARARRSPVASRPAVSTASPPPVAQAHCFQCGAALAAGVRFCGSCGTAVGAAAPAAAAESEGRYCWSCDMQITVTGRNAANERTCLRCAARIDYPEAAGAGVAQRGRARQIRRVCEPWSGGSSRPTRRSASSRRCATIAWRRST